MRLTAITLCLTASLAYAQTYRLIDLGLVDDQPFLPVCINNNGVIAGYVERGNQASARSYTWRDGCYLALGSLGGETIPQAINDNNVVVGYSFDYAGRSRAVKFSAAGEILDIMPEIDLNLTAKAVNDA